MNDLPKAVSEGILTIGAKNIRVIHMDNGERVLDAGDVQAFFYDGGDAERLRERLVLDTVLTQRDELLAACKQTIEELRSYYLGTGYPGLSKLYTAVEAVLAKHGTQTT